MQPPERMRPATRREQRIVALRSTSSNACSLRSAGQPAASPVSTSAPALLTHTSTLPMAPNACCTIEVQPSGVLRSACSRTWVGPSSSARSWAACDERRKPRPTRAPAAAKATAIAFPIPELAPVTTVRRPASAGSPVCAVKARARRRQWVLLVGPTTALALGAAGERMARCGRLSEHLVHARLALDGPRDRLLHRLVVVVVD